MFVVTYRTSTNPTIITNVVSGSELCNMWCDYSFDIIDVEAIDRGAERLLCLWAARSGAPVHQNEPPRLML